MEKRSNFIGVNSIKFYNRFLTDESCFQYLSNTKWGETDYVCRKCGGINYCKGVKPYSRRCTRCKYDESPTAGTLFDKCKFPLHLAFHIAFKISTKKKGMSSLELSQEYDLRQMTCWQFKWKMQQVMESSYKYPLTGTVHVDEFFVGGEEEGKPGRSKGKKILVIVALEIVDRGVGRAYAWVIEDGSHESFKPFFEAHIAKDAKIVTDEWNGYKPLRKEYPLLRQVPSNKGANLKQLHIHIMNIQGWLRGIHHHCSKERLQGYLNEYHFRYNRRNNMDTIFNLLIKRMVSNSPIRLNKLD